MNKKGWISVDDRLPEIDRLVLTFNIPKGEIKYGWYEAALIQSYDKCWVTTQLDCRSPTYWQPLPEPPEGERG